MENSLICTDILDRICCLPWLPFWSSMQLHDHLSRFNLKYHILLKAIHMPNYMPETRYRNVNKTWPITLQELTMQLLVRSKSKTRVQGFTQNSYWQPWQCLESSLKWENYPTQILNSFFFTIYKGLNIQTISKQTGTIFVQLGGKLFPHH